MVGSGEDLMDQKDSISQISDIFVQKSKLIYKFVALYNRYAGISRDYGTGDEVTMSEAHTLEAISDFPGITITELSKMQNKTTGAVAQIITKLDKRGYLIRRPHETNKKKVCYYLSEAGQKLADCHEKFDVTKFTALIAALLEEYSLEELDLFFRIIDSYNHAIEQRTYPSK